MNDLGIGKLIRGEQHRDAIHIAVVPMTAQRNLVPGEYVDKNGGDTETIVGIVDPFLIAPVKKGERFWCFLRPGSITSLRHEWTHPEFEQQQQREPFQYTATEVLESQEWIRGMVQDHDCGDYDSVMAAAHAYCDEGDKNDYLTIRGASATGEIPAGFWRHFEVVTGKRPKITPTYFSCSC